MLPTENWQHERLDVAMSMLPLDVAKSNVAKSKLVTCHVVKNTHDEYI